MAKLAILLFFILFTMSLQAQSGTVVLNVKGIRVKEGGEISAGLFNKKENFPKVGKQFIGKELTVNATEMQVVFKNVPAGDYALVVYQDIDKNKDLKTNLLGYPREPIGFANDAKINFGPPSFDDAKIKVEKDKTTTLTITLK